MRKIFILLALIFFISDGISQEVNHPENLIQYLHKDSQKLHYSAAVTSKALFRTDTIFTEYEVYLRRNKEDSVYGYDFKVVLRESVSINLNGALYTFWKLDGKTYFLKAIKKDNTLNQLLLPNLQLNDEDLADSLHTSILKTNEGYVVKKHYDSIAEVRDIDLSYEFSTKEKQLVSFTSSVNFQDDEQYKHVDFGKLGFDFDIDFSTELEQLLKDAEPFERSERTEIDQKRFPRIEGTLLNDDHKIGLEYFKSELLVLDYWYFRCYPCIKAIPQLKSINAKFPDSLVRVVGVNIIDDRIVDKAYLEKFIKKNKVDYPSIFTKENPLSINSFPSVIIIDKNFNILYVGSGYSESMEEELTEVIEKHLLKNSNNSH